MATRKTITERDGIRTITTHYVDGEFVESHGREVMDIIKPTLSPAQAEATPLMRMLNQRQRFGVRLPQ
jgi:hypothetical protein